MNIERRISELEEQLCKLKAEKEAQDKDPLRVAFEKAKAKCKRSPSERCVYWHINENSGSVYARSCTTEEESAFSDFCRGNFFVSREEAEQALKNRRVHVFLRALAGGFEPDWDDGWQSKWVYGKMTFTGGGYMWQVATVHLPNTVYFREPIENIEELVDAKFGEGALEQYLKGDLV